MPSHKGLIIEIQTGQSFEEYVTESILNPIGLRNTHMFREDAGAAMANGYKINFLRARVFDAPIYRGNKPAGYILSNGNDVAIWMMTQLGFNDESTFDRSLIERSHEFWEPLGQGKWNHSPLRVAAVPDGASEPTVPVAYASFGYMIDNPETEPIARALVAHLVRGLVLLHTHRVRHDLHDGFFGVVYNNLLEKLWMDFAADAALGKLGICEHCSDVFEAMSERKDVKRYCSVTCQANAKSARQYRRRKIRELAAELGRRPTLEEAQMAVGSYDVTEEMLGAALK